MTYPAKRRDLSEPFPAFAAEIGSSLKKQLTFPPIPGIMNWLREC